jgi:hypothetical protein
MRKIIILLLAISVLIPNKAQSQNKGDAAVAVAAGVLAIGAGIAAVKKMEERAELKATEWVLASYPEMTSFELKTLDFEGKKLKDMSSVSVILFHIQEFVPQDKPELNGKKHVLFGFTSRGWISEQGINFSKVRWQLVDEAEWINMMTSYVKVSSNEKNESSIKGILKQGKIVNKGVKVKSKLTIPFFKMSGDMYVVTDYSDTMKLVYNERSLGIFLKETRDLVQVGRSEIIKIHDFFFSE